MEKVFFSMPVIYVAVLAIMYVIMLYAVWFSANVVAKFMLKQQCNRQWKPSKEDMKNKNYAMQLTFVMQIVMAVVMLMHLSFNLHLWSCSLTEILLTLLVAFLPLIIVVLISVLVIAHMTIKHYLKKHIKH